MLKKLKSLVPTDVNPVVDADIPAKDKKRQHEESIRYLWGRVHGWTAAKACVEAKIPINRPAYWRGASSQWAELERDCVAAGNGHIEDHAYMMAVDGVKEGIYHQGAKVDTKIVRDNRLLEKMLAARLPDKYGTARQVVQHTVNTELSPGQQMQQRVRAQLAPPKEEPIEAEFTEVKDEQPA